MWIRVSDGIISPCPLNLSKKNFSRRITESELQQVLYKATSLYLSFTFILIYLLTKRRMVSKIVLVVCFWYSLNHILWSSQFWTRFFWSRFKQLRIEAWKLWTLWTHSLLDFKSAVLYIWNISYITSQIIFCLSLKLSTTTFFK